jgi:hypothetical protein
MTASKVSVRTKTFFQLFRLLCVSETLIEAAGSIFPDIFPAKEGEPFPLCDEGLCFFYCDFIDFYSGIVDMARITRGYRHQDIHAIHQLTKNAMFSVQMRSGAMSD